MTDEVKTIRAPRTKDRPYFSMARTTAQDITLTWEARGVLAYLLSKPDDWQVMIKDLQQNCGRDKARTILKELQDHHYLIVEQVHDNRGKFSRNQYRVFETPFTENPSTGSPSTANPPLTYNREEQSIEKQSAPNGTGNNSKPKAPRPANPIFDAVALGSWGLNNVNGDKTVGAMIGKIVKWLKGHDAEITAERITEFYEWYADENENTSAPRDVGKFGGWWLKFEAQADEQFGGNDPFAQTFANLT